MHIQKFKLVALLLLLLPFALLAQDPATKPSGPSIDPSKINVADSVQVTLILKHQQNKNLTEIRRKLESNGFWDLFPPKEARILSWNIVMGLGQVITIQLPATAVRSLHLAIQNGAWGAYDTEIYMSYNYLDIWKDYIEKREEARADKD